MKKIETEATVTADHRLMAEVPVDIEPGTHQVVVVFADEEAPRKTTRLDIPSYPIRLIDQHFTMRREEIYGDDGR